MLEQDSLPLTDNPIRLPLRINFAWVFSGNVIYAVCQWGVLILITKLGSPEMVGQYALALAITAPIMLFSDLALRAVLITDAKHDFLFSHYLALRLITTTVAFLAIVLVAVVSGYRLETSIVIFIVGLAKAFDLLGDIFLGLLQQHERMDRTGKSMMLTGVLSLLMVAVGLSLTKGVVFVAIGSAVATLLVLITYDVPSALLVMQSNELRTLRPRWESHRLMRLVRLTFPLGLSMMLISLTANIPRYFIERALGERELGLFAAIAYLITAGSTVVGALGQAASPRLAKYYAANDAKAFRELLVRLIAIGVALGTVGVIAALTVGQTILTVLYQPVYGARIDVFVWVMLAALVIYVTSFLGYGMTASHFYNIQPFIFVAAAATSFAACLWLVPTYGMIGAAWAMILSSSVQLCLTLGVNVRAVHVMARRSELR